MKNGIYSYRRSERTASERETEKLSLVLFSNKFKLRWPTEANHWNECLIKWKLRALNGHFRNSKLELRCLKQLLFHSFNFVCLFVSWLHSIISWQIIHKTFKVVVIMNETSEFQLFIVSVEMRNIATIKVSHLTRRNESLYQRNIRELQWYQAILFSGNIKSESYPRRNWTLFALTITFEGIKWALAHLNIYHGMNKPTKLRSFQNIINYFAIRHVQNFIFMWCLTYFAQCIHFWSSFQFKQDARESRDVMGKDRYRSEMCTFQIDEFFNEISIATPFGMDVLLHFLVVEEWQGIWCVHQMQTVPVVRKLWKKTIPLKYLSGLNHLCI